MKTENLNQKLGKGIYTIPEVAFILKLPLEKVRRWMNEFWDGRLSKKYGNVYSTGEGRNKVTNFYTLIEFYVFYQLRELNVSTNKIFIAHQDMAEEMNSSYPFATSKLLCDGKNILYMMDEETIINADKSKQLAFKQIIEEFCKKIEFSDSDVAEKFYPLGKDKHIIVDPHHQFGQPTVESTNVLAQTLYELYKAGESKGFLASLYDLTEKDVNDAIELFNKTAA